MAELSERGTGSVPLAAALAVFAAVLLALAVRNYARTVYSPG